MAKAHQTWIVLPHQLIEKLTENLWRVEGDLPGVPLKRVMTVAKRADGDLLLHNPMALEAPAMTEIDAFGPVRYLVVPNGSHRLDSKIFKDRYPQARVYCPSGARKKVAEVVPVDGAYADVPADAAMALRDLAGTGGQEGVMEVRSADGVTLVFNDIIMNMPHAAGIQGFVLRHLAGASGGVKLPWVIRLLKVEDRRALQKDLERLADTPGLRRVIVSHHEMIRENAAGALQAVAQGLGYPRMGTAGRHGLIRQHAFRRCDPGYEAARRATMWNARLPDRYPDLIVRAADVFDVVAAVRLARREGLRLSVRSGGHGWAGNHLRDGGLLLDVSALREVAIDQDALRATAGPGCPGHELCELLGRRGLFFPTGHCRGVCVGGYLLQGGFGWHSRVLGPACMSVVGLDLVTADGDLVHASPDENADLYWAARGAGPGFFGVVVRFHLRVYPRPRVIGFAMRTYSLDALEDVFRWAHAVGPEVPASVELQLMMSRRATRAGGPGIEVVAPVFADSLRGALADLAFLNRGAVPRKAALKLPFVPAPMSLLYRASMQHCPEGTRWSVDNMWTSAPIDALLPALRRIAETLPPPPSFMTWLNWAPPKGGSRPDMAFSMEDDIYITLYGGWRSAADDARYGTWAEDHMREMQPLASGCNLADENLGRRPARFISDEHLARLDRIRAARDPDNRFYPWMGRPAQ